MPEEDARRGKFLDLKGTVGGGEASRTVPHRNRHWRPGGSAGEQFGRLRPVAPYFDEAWDLVQIGSPVRTRVPITLRQRRTEAPPDSDPTDEAAP